MTNILELSSDSSDTILLSEGENLSQRKSDNDVDVQDLVNKYISENCFGKDIGGHSTGSNSKNEDLDAPLTKRLKFDKPLSTNTSFDSSTSQNESTEESDALLILSEKYKKFASSKGGGSDDVGALEKVEPVIDKVSKKREKEIQKQIKMKEKEQKKREAEQEKCIKKALAEANKNLKRTECMKFMTVEIDQNIAPEEYGSEVISALTVADVKYKIKSQIFPHTVTWSRQVQSHSIDDNGKVVLITEELEADEMLLIMNCKEFVDHINKKSLCAHIQSLKSVLANKKITLAIYGLESYYRFLKNPKKNNAFFKDFPKVTKQMIEYGLTELQLMCSCSHRLIDSATDVGLLVTQFTKAVAEIPFKLQKYEKFQQIEWFASGDNRDCVKVDKNGNGLNRLWNQMLTTFPLARLETAEAISSQYPTVSSLMTAYDNCASAKEAELLLSDIPVRRAAGLLSSSRKIGPELSKKIYNFFTSTDGESLV